MSFLLLALFVATSPLPTFCTTEEFFVSPTPPPNPACPSGKPCHTLDEYAQNEELYFGLSSNIRLLFLNGTHEMLPTLVLEVSDRQQLTLSGFNSSFEFNYPQAVVRSMSARFAGIMMMNVENISISMGYTNNTEVCLVVIFQVMYLQHQVNISRGSKILIQRSSFNESSFYLTFKNAVFQDIHCVELFNNTLTFKISDSNFMGIDSKLKIYVRTSLWMELTISAKLAIYSVKFKQSSISISASLPTTSSVVLEIVNSSITSSGQVDSSGPDSPGLKSAVLILSGPINVTVDSCYVRNNKQVFTTVQLYKINLYFKGNSSFLNNIASTGGAIYMRKSIL